MATPELTRHPSLLPRPAAAVSCVIDAYVAVWALTLLAATAFTLIPGAPELARDLLGAKLTPAPRGPGVADILQIAFHNVRVCGWPLLLGVLGAQHHRWSRWTAHAAVNANLTVNTALVGAAVGGYGHRILPFLPHLPVEWAALAVGAGCWWTIAAGHLARRQAIWLLVFLVAAALLAATLELTATPHR
jgi:hypothetical protein